YAWQHLRMTPLRDVIPDTPAPPDTFIMELLHKIGGHGFEAFVKLWFSRLHSEITAFENKRLRDLLTAAREFDATGNRNTGDFLEYLEAYEVEDGGNPHAVQVMTVHKAKGLQFDMVLLPALDRGSGINSVRSGGLHIEKTDTADRTPCWVLDMPRKDIALADPVLADTLESLKADAAYEEMCNLYVAMTRAKYALYMFRTEAGRSSHAVYPSTVAAAGLAREVPEQITLGEQLAELLYKCGDPSWHEKLAPPEPQPPRELPRLKKRDNSRNRRRYQRETPSGDEETETRASWLFSPENDEFAAFGRALHAFASQIEWYREDLNLDKVFDETVKDLDTEPYIARDAFAQLQTAFQAPAIREALSKPQNPAEVWLEKSFEMVLNNTWISGIFDRVVIEYNDAGQPVKATIIDYKTSVITGPDSLAANRRKYTPQLRTYRKALARMTGLAEKDIIARLIFTKTADIINLD
ncbi:MAG: 3'-5' exonuclease, partial [Lentisphaeria bacterium]